MWEFGAIEAVHERGAVIASPVMERSGVESLRVALGVVVLACLLVSVEASAQTDEERAGARAAATQGAQAFSEGRWDAAIDMFSRAESLVHSPVHLLYQARAYVKLGQLVKARETYLKIIGEELPADAPAVFRDARSDAEKELEVLEPRVPYVSVVVQGAGGKDVRVTMDGVAVPPALIGVPRPVDPGEHAFQAFAEGMESARSSLDVKEGRKETVVLTLQPVSVAPSSAAASSVPPAPPPGAAPVAPSSAPSSPMKDQPAEPGGRPGLEIGGWAALGVGVAGLAAGTAFGLRAKSKRSDADGVCRAGYNGVPNAPQAGRTDLCDVSDRKKIDRLDNQADSASTLAVVGFAVGGVGIVTGVTLLVLGYTSGGDDAASERSVRPWVGWRSAGITGRF